MLKMSFQLVLQALQKLQKKLLILVGSGCSLQTLSNMGTQVDVPVAFTFNEARQDPGITQRPADIGWRSALKPVRTVELKRKEQPHAERIN